MFDLEEESDRDDSEFTCQTVLTNSPHKAKKRYAAKKVTSLQKRRCIVFPDASNGKPSQSNDSSNLPSKCINFIKDYLLRDFPKNGIDGTKFYSILPR